MERNAFSSELEKPIFAAIALAGRQRCPPHGAGWPSPSRAPRRPSRTCCGCGSRALRSVHGGGSGHARHGREGRRAAAATRRIARGIADTPLRDRLHHREGAERARATTAWARMTERVRLPRCRWPWPSWTTRRHRLKRRPPPPQGRVRRRHLHGHLHGPQLCAPWRRRRRRRRPSQNMSPQQ